MSSSKKQIQTYRQKALFAVVVAIAAESLSRHANRINDDEVVVNGKN